MTTSNASDRRSPLWWVLARHEWRLTVRAFFAGRARPSTGAKASIIIGSKVRIAIWIVAVVLFHVLAFGLASALPRRLHDDPDTRLVALLATACLFTLMLSSAMSRVVAAFHERRDLELLLAAPIAPSLILVVRTATVVAAVSLTFAIFLYPLANMGVATGRWWAARLYLLVPLMALLTTAVALTLAGAVVRLIGVRRARVGLQIFSALVGASFYLASQARQFLPPETTTWASDRLMRTTHDAHPGWPIAFATRLALGDGWTWLVFTVGSIALYAGSVRLAGRRFVEVARTPDADGRVAVPKRSTVDRRIASGFARGLFATVLVKEWRLILRAPQLISQVLLQLLYLMPLLFVAFGRRDGITWGAAAFAAGIVGLTGTLATSLAWLTVLAEDAPDLLAGSPTGRARIVAAKLFAAALPPIALLTLAAIGTARRSVLDASTIFVFGVLACASAAIITAASPTSARRSDFQRRHAGRGFMALIEMFQFLVWAVAAGLAVHVLWTAAAVATLLALVTPALYLPRALRGVRR